jgi:hypothetical protein
LTGILSELRGDKITLPPQRCWKQANEISFNFVFV